MVNSIPVFWVKSEAEAVADAPCSALPLEGAGLRYKSFHQGTHLAALMVPEQKKLTKSRLLFPIEQTFMKHWWRLNVSYARISPHLVNELLLVFFGLSSVDDKHNIRNSHTGLSDISWQHDLKKKKMKMNEYICLFCSLLSCSFSVMVRGCDRYVPVSNTVQSQSHRQWRHSRSYVGNSNIKMNNI